MLIEKVIGNIGTEEEIADKKTEWIELDWEELSKRILRTETDKGTDVALRLESGRTACNTGIFYLKMTIVALQFVRKWNLLLSSRPKDMTEMGKAAFELGNRHTPSLIDDNEIIVRADHTLNKLLDEVGVAYETTERRFKQPFKYRGHSH